MEYPIKIDLKDKVAVVTGAGGILCSCLAEALAKVGAKTALLDLNEDAAKQAAEQIMAQGFIAKGYACNVLEKDSLETAHQQILSDFGKCDLLINGAGGNHPAATTENEFHHPEDLGQKKTFFDLEPSGIKFVFDLNYMGTLLPTQVFAQDMLGKEGCSIINISSMNSFTPLTKIPAYSGAKAAVSNLTQWLAVHFSKVVIRCNALAPGFFVTKQNEKLLYQEDKTPTKRTEKILRNTPMYRFGTSEELIGTLLYLVEPSLSGFVNGVVIPIDGGFSAYSGV